MTNKTSKSVQKAKAGSGAWQVVKHFEPKVSKLSEIPLVNNDFDLRDICAKPAPKLYGVKTKKCADRPHSTNIREPSTRKDRFKTVKQFVNHSSSSNEAQVARNVQKKRARSSPAKQPFLRVNEQPAASSPRFLSGTDPALLKNRVNLNHLKEEILNYKKDGSKRDRVDFEDAKVKGLRDEIYQTKDRNNLQRQILITELKTEIAEYKKFGSYHVYNLHSEQTVSRKRSPTNGAPNSKWGRDAPRSNAEFEETSTEGVTESEVESLGTISEPLSKGSSTLTDGSDIKDETNNSADNDSIKSKINEANAIIGRIRDALTQIKTMKPPESSRKRAESNFSDAVNDLRTEAESLLYQIDNRGDETLPLSRPKTRRNENDDVSSKGDKFLTVPDDGEVEVTSSIEALHAKLHTISESTESSFSTPRQRKSTNEIAKQHSSKELVSLGCNTEVTSASKEIQVSWETRSVGVQRDHNSHINASTQTSPPKTFISETFDLVRVPPRSTDLSPASFVIQDVHATKTKARPDLSFQSLGAHCLSPKRSTKLEKLTIQSLPSVTIPTGRCVQRTLKLSIAPDGICQNHLENSANVAFVEIKHSISADSVRTVLHSCTTGSEPKQGSVESGKTIVFRSLRHLSSIDALFYKTFIDPEGLEGRKSLASTTDWVSEGPVHAWAGLESKEVQCPDSLVINDATPSEITVTLSYSTEEIEPKHATGEKRYAHAKCGVQQAELESDRDCSGIHRNHDQTTLSTNETQYGCSFDHLIAKNAATHLELASNGRYKDEANLFCENTRVISQRDVRKQRVIGDFPKFHAKHFRNNKMAVNAANALKKHAKNHQKVAIHKKLNYFTNWVTYYVKTKEFLTAGDSGE
ncbi:uncharacterized protein LOC132705566 [Cylas formicarius]|uniref:uncharacterized protein LOC132705566 n=1 Tax=Cylas formicarius TaxID=197179 RepID=UPI00295897CF|nr:uncharacterized protein LOC132705566 [Cylas formicarius]